MSIYRAIALLKYLAVVWQDGDYLNDWLTWLDHETAARIEPVGRLIAIVIFVNVRQLLVRHGYPS